MNWRNFLDRLKFCLMKLMLNKYFHRFENMKEKQLQENKTNNTATATAVNADEIIDT